MKGSWGAAPGRPGDDAAAFFDGQDGVVEGAGRGAAPEDRPGHLSTEPGNQVHELLSLLVVEEHQRLAEAGERVDLLGAVVDVAVRVGDVGPAVVVHVQPLRPEP